MQSVPLPDALVMSSGFAASSAMLDVTYVTMPGHVKAPGHAASKGHESVNVPDTANSQVDD